MIARRRRRAAAAGLVALLAGGAGAMRATETVKLRPRGAAYVDGAGNGMAEPTGVACASGKLAVADPQRGHVLLFEVRDDALRPSGEIVVSELPRPKRIAFLADGSLLVLDGRTGRIGRVTAAAEFRGWLAPEGESLSAWSLAVGPRDRVYAVDAGKRRIVVLASAGAVERVIAFPPEVRFVSDIAVDPRGEVYAVDSVARRVHVAREGDTALAPLSGALDEDLDFPTSIAVDGEAHLYVIDENGGGVVILGRDGAFRGRQSGMGWKEGLLRYPVDACVDDGRNLFVAERANRRVQRFSLR